MGLLVFGRFSRCTPSLCYFFVANTKCDEILKLHYAVFSWYCNEPRRHPPIPEHNLQIVQTDKKRPTGSAFDFLFYKIHGDTVASTMNVIFTRDILMEQQHVGITQRSFALKSPHSFLIHALQLENICVIPKKTSSAIFWFCYNFSLQTQRDLTGLDQRSRLPYSILSLVSASNFR